MNSQAVFTILSPEDTDPAVAVSAASRASAAAEQLIILARESQKSALEVEAAHAAIMRPLSQAPEWARPGMIAKLPQWQRQIGLQWRQSLIRATKARAAYDEAMQQSARVFTVAANTGFSNQVVISFAASSVSCAAAELAAIFEDCRLIAKWNNAAQQIKE